MQVPIEKRHGAFVAILISSVFFMAIHLTKDWSLIGMVPIVFVAGALYGTLAWASRSLVFCMIGHTIMAIGLFAYWWTQILGSSPSARSQRSEWTGISMSRAARARPRRNAEADSAVAAGRTPPRASATFTATPSAL